MNITLPAEVEAKLHSIAADSGRDLSEAVEEMTVSQIEHDASFRAEVEKGRAALEAGRFLTHEEVGQQLSKYLDRQCKSGSRSLRRRTSRRSSNTSSSILWPQHRT